MKNKVLIFVGCFVIVSLVMFTSLRAFNSQRSLQEKLIQIASANDFDPFHNCETDDKDGFRLFEHSCDTYTGEWGTTSTCEWVGYGSCCPDEESSECTKL